MSTSTNSHDHAHHVTPPSKLASTLFILAILMGLTILAAQVDFGHIISSKVGGSSALGSYINNIVALTIAIIKACFVIQIFMGVKYGSKLVKMWAYAGFVWVVLLGITFGDYTSRTWESHRGWNPGDSDVTLPASKIDENKMEIQKKHAEEDAAKGGSGH